MAELEVDYLESRLLEEREQTLESIQQVAEEESEGQREASGELSRMPTHLADAASDTQEAEKDLANATRESHKLAQIDEALRLLREDAEAYATCERCGRTIESQRLDMVPWTRLCASCSRELDSGTADTSG
jgi:RNA polymerase-binding transcription factor DksA